MDNDFLSDVQHSGNNVNEEVKIQEENQNVTKRRPDKLNETELFDALKLESGYIYTMSTSGILNKSTLYVLLDSDKYIFMGGHAPWVSPVVKLGGRSSGSNLGLFLLRYKIKTQEDVQRAKKELLEKKPLIGIKNQNLLKTVEKKIQDVYNENQVLPYILGGAFLYLANHDSDDQLKKIQGLQTYWLGMPDDIASKIIDTYDNHVLTVMKGSKDRSSAINKIIISRGRKLPWWDYFSFPIKKSTLVLNKKECKDLDIKFLINVAKQQKLFIVDQREGLQRLCNQLSRKEAKNFLIIWRGFVDKSIQFLKEKKNVQITDHNRFDEGIQQYLLLNGLKSILNIL